MFVAGNFFIPYATESILFKPELIDSNNQLITNSLSKICNKIKPLKYFNTKILRLNENEYTCTDLFLFIIIFYIIYTIISSVKL